MAIICEMVWSNVLLNADLCNTYVVQHFSIVLLFAILKTNLYIKCWPELQTQANNEDVFIFIEHYEQQGPTTTWVIPPGRRKIILNCKRDEVPRFVMAI